MTAYRDRRVLLEGELAELRGEAEDIAEEMDAAERTRARSAQIERRVAEIEDELRRVSSAERPRLQLAERCPLRWSELARVEEGSGARVDDGDSTDAVRFCGTCNQHVFDLRHMSEEEMALFLWERTGTRTCGKIFARPDGGVIGRDCTAQNPRRALAIFGGATAAVTAAALGLALQDAPSGQPVTSSVVDTSLRPAPAPTHQPAPDIDDILASSEEALGVLIPEVAPLVVRDLGPIGSASSLRTTRPRVAIAKHDWIVVGALSLPAVANADERVVHVAVDRDRPSNSLAQLDGELEHAGIREIVWDKASPSMKIEGSRVKFRLALGKGQTADGPTKLAYGLIQEGDERVFIALVGANLTRERVEAFFLPVVTDAHRLP